MNPNGIYFFNLIVLRLDKLDSILRRNHSTCVIHRSFHEGLFVVILKLHIDNNFYLLISRNSRIKPNIITDCSFIYTLIFCIDSSDQWRRIGFIPMYRYSSHLWIFDARNDLIQRLLSIFLNTTLHNPRQTFLMR